jgi:hypothetical protein
MQMKAFQYWRAFIFWSGEHYLFTNQQFRLYAITLPAGKGRSATKPAHKGFSGVAASTCLPAGTVGANFEHLFFHQ